MLNPCTCGEAHPHEVARRHTFDGYDVCLWSDGAVTGALGRGLRGVPIARPRTPEAQALALKAGRLLLGEVCLWKAEELGDLYKAAKKAARGSGLPGDVRAEMKRQADAVPPISIVWTVLIADRNGKPTERFGRLPRLLYPGLGIWDFCGGPGSSRGRYALVKRIPTQWGRDGSRTSDETWSDTGFTFHRLADLYKHLRGE